MVLILEYVVSPILVAGLGYIVWLLQLSKKTGDANATGTMLLLRREIIDDHRRFLIEGEAMTPDDFAYIDEVYQAYKALKGNGMADKLYNEIKSKETMGAVK